MDDNSADLQTHTAILDYNNAEITALIEARGWRELPEFERIGAIYDFVRNEIKFGYNRADDIPASEVLSDGYGQCNTKGTLLMALFRAVGIGCRIHGFTIKKALQRGVVPELVYPIAPDNILHSWVEIKFDGNWVNLEGFILDEVFLKAIQRGVAREDLCGYGVGTENLSAPQVAWEGKSTYIQKTGINQDFGVFDSPDALYERHQQKFSFIKKWLYRLAIRHWMNARVGKIRSGRLRIKGF